MSTNPGPAWAQVLAELLDIEGLAPPPDYLEAGPPGDATDPTRGLVPPPRQEPRS